MKYVKEFGIILIVSLVGELLNYFLPLPVPASIYVSLPDVRRHQAQRRARHGLLSH